MAHDAPIEIVYRFNVSGKITAPATLKPSFDAVGEICALCTDDEQFRLLVAIEAEKPSDTYTVLSTDAELQARGLSIYEYDSSSFELDEEETIIYDAANRGLTFAEVMNMAERNAKASGEILADDTNPYDYRQWATNDDGRFDDAQVKSLGYTFRQ